MRTWHLLALSALGTSGCFASPYDGTWLFLIDYEPGDVSGDCVNNNADYTVSYEGTSNMLVDIYTTKADGIVVLFSDSLYGTFDSSGFEAESEQTYQYSSNGYSEAERDGYVMEATKTASLLEGEIQQFYNSADSDGYSYDCETTYEFTAERIASSQNKYPED